MIMKLLLLVFVLLLSGCASLQYAGSADYSLEPVLVDGAIVCCKVSVKNGKEIALVKVHAEKRGDDYVFTLEERGVQAFTGQAIAGEAIPAAGGVIAPLLPLLSP